MSTTAVGPKCSRCGAEMTLRDPQFAVPYWACDTLHDPPEVAAAGREIGYATALVRSRILDPLDDQRLEAFEAEYTVDPAMFVDSVCNRLHICIESDREREHKRYRDRSVSGTTSGSNQAFLVEFHDDPS